MIFHLLSFFCFIFSYPKQNQFFNAHRIGCLCINHKPHDSYIIWLCAGGWLDIVISWPDDRSHMKIDQVGIYNYNIANFVFLRLILFLILRWSSVVMWVVSGLNQFEDGSPRKRQEERKKAEIILHWRIVVDCVFVELEFI